MGEVVGKRDTPWQCWANLKLENGDQVMISVAAVMGKGAQVEVGGHDPRSDIMEIEKHCRN